MFIFQGKQFIGKDIMVEDGWNQNFVGDINNQIRYTVFEIDDSYIFSKEYLHFTVWLNKKTFWQLELDNFKEDIYVEFFDDPILSSELIAVPTKKEKKKLPKFYEGFVGGNYIKISSGDCPVPSICIDK
jgi:hypothetical protein